MATVAISLALTIGGMILQRLFQPKPKDVYGPRLSDINVPGVSPGNPIPRLWGTMKVPGQLLWNSKLKETQHMSKAQGGGSLAPKQPKEFSYTYAMSCAI